jgi:hypothetical protein
MPATKPIVYTIEDKARVIALYRFGYPWKYIVEATAIPFETCRGWCRNSGFTKGDLENDAINQAVELLGKNITKEMAARVLGVASNSLNLANQANELAGGLMAKLAKEKLESVSEIGKAARALAAIATAIKASGDFARHLKTDMNLETLEGDVLPFVLQGMTGEDLARIQAEVQLDIERAKLGEIPPSRLAIDARAAELVEEGKREILADFTDF